MASEKDQEIRIMDLKQFYEYINSSGNHPANADGARKIQKNINKSILEQSPKKIGFSEVDPMLDGRVNISLNEIEYECYFRRRENSGYLYVFFSGAKMGNDTLPLFKRWSYSEYLDCNSVCISDPMLRIWPKLRLGWYYGTEKECFISSIAEIVKKYADECGIPYSNIIFYSSSGGGYAAVYCASLIDNSVCAVINPQLSLEIDDYSGKFEQITGIDLKCSDPLFRNDIVRIMNPNSKYIIINNIRSSTDMKQLDYLRSKTQIAAPYGLSRSNNIITWLYDADHKPFHNAQEWRTMFMAIDHLARNFDSFTNESYGDLYRIINEMWHEHFEAVSAEKKYKRKLQTFVAEIAHGTDKNAEKELVSEGNIHISSGNNKYAYKMIYDKFIGCSLYYLEISEAAFSEAQYSVIIKDQHSDTIIFEKNAVPDKCTELWFYTGQCTDKLELRIYPGTPGKTENKEFGAEYSLYNVL